MIKSRIIFILVVTTIFFSGCSFQRETWKMVSTASPQAINAAIIPMQRFPTHGMRPNTPSQGSTRRCISVPVVPLVWI